MNKIQWNDELSVGVEQIDDQHKELIRIANALINAVTLERDQRIINNVLNKLREYTIHHFNSEEQLMEKIGFPKRGEHATEHARLKKEVKEYQHQVYLKENLTPDALLEFLKNWLLKHILTYDRDIARFMHKKGMETKPVETKKQSAPITPAEEADVAEIKWNNELSVGVERIDDEHKELIRIANALIKAVVRGKDKQALDRIVQKLREYTVFHFKNEEELMESIRYPERGEQAREHNRLKREVKDFQRQVYHKENVTPDAILEFVKDWLLKHILAYDRALARFIHEQAAKKEGVVETGHAD